MNDHSMINTLLQGTQISGSNNSTFKPVLEINTIEHLDLSLKDIIKQDNFLNINGVDVIIRKEDGYFNLTKMCQTGGKDFSGWLRNKSNQTFLDVLSSSLQICRDELIKYQSGSIYERSSWGHPQVAIVDPQRNIDCEISGNPICNNCSN